MAFHNDLQQVRKYLRPIYVGEIETTTMTRDDQMRKDFAELRATAEKQVEHFVISVFKFLSGNYCLIT